MSKSNPVIRFAFGTPERQGSSVWRVCGDKKHGDIYINNLPSFAQEVHIALHASGKFSLKLGNNVQRHRLEPPLYSEETGLISGPCIFFSGDPSNLKPAPATSSIHKINWLGWPEKGYLMVVRMYYLNEDDFLILQENEKVIGYPLKARVQYEDKKFFLVVEHRRLMEKEKDAYIENNIPYNDYRRLDFHGNIPVYGEMIKISKRTEAGISAIVIEGVNVV